MAKAKCQVNLTRRIPARCAPHFKLGITPLPYYSPRSLRIQPGCGNPGETALI